MPPCTCSSPYRFDTSQSTSDEMLLLAAAAARTWMENGLGQPMFTSTAATSSCLHVRRYPKGKQTAV